jgi:hypothetical protein
MVHTYRNSERKRRHLFGDAVFALFWCFSGLLVWLAVAEGIFGGSLLMFVVFAPLFVLWMGPIYADLFRRYYEIRPVSLIPGSGFRRSRPKHV